MRRGENIVAGTSTTGTGTLTLAACPSAFGGINPVTAFGTSGAYPVAYTIIEYTSSSYSTPSQYETGVGVLTLAATIASATLTRAPLTTGVIATPAYSGEATTPTAITIGSAANTIMFFGPNGHSIIQALYFDAGSGITNADNLGISPVQAALATGSTVSLTTSTTNGSVVYQRVWITRSALLKSVSVRVTGALTTATSSTVKAALYDIGSSGLPTKQLIDFGTSSTGALNATGTVTMTAGAALFIPAGFYILAILPFGGASSSGTATLKAATSCAPSPFGTNMVSTGTGGPPGFATVASQTTLADPATTTSITISTVATEVSLALRST